MRTDAAIDRRQVRLTSKATSFGSCKVTAQVGDVVTYQYPGSDRYATGRMIGRIRYAPPCGETPAIRNWLLVLVLSPTMSLSHAYERWIDPAWVTECRDSEGYAAFLAYFFGPDLPTGEDGRYIAHFGALTTRDAPGPYYDGTATLGEHIEAIMDRRAKQLAGMWKA